MRIFFSILFNALILLIMASLLAYDEKYKTWIIVSPESFSEWAWKVYFIWWVILGLLNALVRPILKFFGLPFLIVTFWTFIFFINAIILWLFSSLIWALNIDWISYEIHWIINFIIAVAIFTFFNTLYNIFIKK